MTSTRAAAALLAAGAVIAICLPASALGANFHSTHVAGSGTSTTAILAAVAAGLLVIGCAAWALSRALTYEPRWSLSASHSLGEAGLRASALWAELVDWARLGR
jgi:cytochrome c oxidase assembly factor CtaG